MKVSIQLFTLCVSAAFGQSFPECTRELARTDECASVINANACYNQYRFNGATTLTCVDGTSDADRKAKV